MSDVNRLAAKLRLLSDLLKDSARDLDICRKQLFEAREQRDEAREQRDEARERLFKLAEAIIVSRAK